MGSLARRRILALLGVASSLALASGCGGHTSSDPGSGAAPNGGGDDRPPSATGGSASSGGSPSIGGQAGMPIEEPRVDGFGCEGLPLGPGAQHPAELACAGVSVSCDRSPTVVHVVLERSSAMAEPLGALSKWEVARRGIAWFAEGLLQDSADVHLFGHPAGAAAGVDCGAASYARADFVLTSGAPAEQTLAMLDATLEGGTPTAPALQGTIRHADQIWSEGSAANVIVLITARAPDQCDGDLGRIIAASGQRVYVIGLEPDFDVDAPAAAAGTRPFELGKSDGPERLQQALQHVLRGGGARSCDEGLAVDAPLPGAALDYARTRLSFDGVEIPLVASRAACASSPNGGFYFDDPAAPTRAFLCPCSCAYVGCGEATLYYSCK